MNDTMTIKTNNVPRYVLYWYELTDAERAEFDYLDSDDAQASASFFRHRGSVYDLGEFMVSSIKGWDGIRSDSYFSGILIRYVEDYERIVVATYYC